MFAGCGDAPPAAAPDLRAPIDQARPADLVALVDGSVVDAATAVDGALPDAAVPDLAVPDLAAPELPDLIEPPDQTSPPDLALPDLAMPDLVTIDLAPKPDLTPPPDLAPLPDLAPSCNDQKKNGSETDIDCGGSCPACGLGKACAVLNDCQAPALCKAMMCQAASTCLELKAQRPATPDGSYALVGGAAYCDMTGDGGGWNLVMNQVPGQLLPDSTADVNAASFGTLNQSWRIGSATIKKIAPTVAWKLTDAGNKVYLKPACVVDWTVDYLAVMAPNVCTTGYKATDFSSVVNGGWVYTGAHGIGINNSGQNCSIRAYNSKDPNPQGVPAGGAASCNYTTIERVSLWYK
ncbi:MAG: hypothetical protein EXR72_03840 [Myxococcales bacterium]|nr:hypothetical protein [Myxococcales bacterium]